MNDLTMPLNDGLKIAIPHDLIEFFKLDPLPCPIEGCSWSGQMLGSHVCRTHGITSAELREILGCCKGQGLCTVAFSKKRSALTRDQENNLLISGEGRFDLANTSKERGPARRQQVQLAIKAREAPAVREKLKAAGRKSKEPHRRKQLGEALNARRKVPTKKVCELCGSEYETNILSARKSRWCSQKCRNDYWRAWRKRHTT